MEDFNPQEKAARILSKRLLDLEDIVRETTDTKDTTLGFEQLRRWKELTVELVAEYVSESEAAALSEKEPRAFVIGQPLRNFLTEAKLYEAFLVSLNETLQRHPERIFNKTVSGRELPPGSAATAITTDLFISYSSKDLEFVKKLAKDLSSSGVHVWWDKLMMKVGDSLHQKIEEGITNSAWLGVVLSPNSVSSPWVKKELNAALMKELERKEVFVLPILYKDCAIPLFLEDKIYADFRESYKLGLNTLLDRFSVGIKLELLEGLMSGSNSKILNSFAKVPEKDKMLYSNELVRKLDSGSAEERANALTGLFTIRGAAIPMHLLKMANDSSNTVRRLAVFYLGELKVKSAVPTISARLSDKNQDVRAAARVAYRKITGANP